MAYRLAADALVLLHLVFILFALLGGLLALKWRPVLALHLPAALWGVLVEVMHWRCPLTRWENLMRQAAGQAGYADSFIEHYLWPLIYPAGLTPAIQWLLGALVLAVNLLIYRRIYQRWHKAP
ncbi:DUF2784 domain-containing protein [Pseudomonas sp. nanlin1]|uniref:DUF2784 domain-containing protein n=1 Tax=Pseudomonas sp. nanlin1 TaxID=3040605 RepID=UPI00388FD34F